MTFTTEGILPVVRKHMEERRAAYDAEVAEWYQENPGYQFPECIHGTSLVTDYDNICGGCEDPRTDDEIAEDWAASLAADLNEREAWLSYAPSNLAAELRISLLQWGLEPLWRLTK